MASQDGSIAPAPTSRAPSLREEAREKAQEPKPSQFFKNFRKGDGNRSNTMTEKQAPLSDSWWRDVLKNLRGEKPLFYLRPRKRCGCYKASIYLLAVPGCLLAGIDMLCRLRHTTSFLNSPYWTIPTLVATFLALIALGAFLSAIIEYLEPIIGSLWATFVGVLMGNFVELIISLFSLFLEKDSNLVRTSLIGGVISNLLCVLALVLFFGPCGQWWACYGWCPKDRKQIDKLKAFGDGSRCRACLVAAWFPKFGKTYIGPTYAYLSAAILSFTALLVPIVPAFRFFFEYPPFADFIINIVCSGVLIVLFFVFCYFSWKWEDDMDEEATLANIKNGYLHRKAEKDIPDKKAKFWLSLTILFFVCLLVSLCSEVFLKHLNILDGIMSGECKDIIIVPIAGNLAEHTSAILFSVKGKTSMALGVTMGSSIQLVGFVLPLLTLSSFARIVPNKVGLTDVTRFESLWHVISILLVDMMLLLPPLFYRCRLRSVHGDKTRIQDKHTGDQFKDSHLRVLLADDDEWVKFKAFQDQPDPPTHLYAGEWVILIVGFGLVGYMSNTPYGSLGIPVEKPH